MNSNEQTIYRTKGGILLPRSIVGRPLAFVDLFAGCGGFSLGMEAAGIDVVAAVENDCNAASSYLYNLGNPVHGCVVGYTSDEYAQKFRRHLQSAQKAAPTIRRQPTLGDHGWIGCNRKDRNKDQGARAFILGDVRDVCGEDIIELLEMHGWTGKLNGVIGGPPCQGFSKASGRSKKTRATDPRNNLVLEYMRIVGELGVETFVMENVAELYTNKAFKPLFQAIVEKANELGFTVTANVLDAVNYGVPQYRRRVFIMGSKRGAIPFPMPTNWGFVARPGQPVNWHEEEEQTNQDDPQVDLFG